MQFFYLILSLYFGRKNPLFYLIFPIAMVSGPGAFIDPRTVLIGEDIFTIGKNMYKDIIILYLFLVALYLKYRFKVPIIRKSPVLVYSFYLVLLILITFATTGTNFEAINLMRLFLYMVLGFFLLLTIFSSANSIQFIAFFNLLFWATGILSIFYVANSSKIFPIFYQENLYQEVDFAQSSFFRDFSTIPYFSHFLFILAFTITLLKTKIFNRKALLLVLCSYPFVLLYTFTRSLLATSIIECVIIITFIAYRNPRLIFNKSTIAFAMTGIILFSIVQSRFASELGYYSERIDEAKTEGVNEGNVLVRLGYHVKAYDIVSQNKSLLTGTGLNKQHETEMETVGAWTADSTLPFLLIYTGLLGIILYYYLSIHFLFRTWSQIRKYFDPLSLTLFAIILFSTLSSFIMGGNRWGDPFIFFPFVLVMATSNLIKRENLFTN